jgi:polysaccharide export outer membrane protein
MKVMLKLSRTWRMAANLIPLWAGLALLAASLQAQAQNLKEVLGGGDSVRVTVFRYPDLTTEGRLSEDGRITLPLVGDVSLQGMTPQDAGRHIAERYKKGRFLVNPQVGVTVMETRSRQVSVLGLVTKPGRYPLEGTTARLSDVIALAGGLQPSAADTVTVVQNRRGKTSRFDVDLPAVMQGMGRGKDIEIQSGDTVFVNRAPVFYIQGEVNRAGAYRVEPGLTVAQAISLAGGMTVRGTERRPQLRRKNGKEGWTQTTAQLFDTVKPDDVIVIRESLF